MSIQAQLNTQAINMLPKVKEVMQGARYKDSMYHSTLNMILDASKCLEDMTKEELESFQNLVLEYFEEREWVGEHPEQFRFDKGSLYEYDKTSDAYIHCFKQVGCNTKHKAIAEYLKQLETGE